MLGTYPVLVPSVMAYAYFFQPYSLTLKAGPGESSAPEEFFTSTRLCLPPPFHWHLLKEAEESPSLLPHWGLAYSHRESWKWGETEQERTQNQPDFHAHAPQCKQLPLSAPSSLLTFIIQNARGRNVKQDQKEYEMVAWSQASQWEVLGHPPRHD